MNKSRGGSKSIEKKFVSVSKIFDVNLERQAYIEEIDFKK